LIFLFSFSTSLRWYLLLFVQGNEDEVVDWRYNIEFLRDKIMLSKIVLIDRGKNDLLAEADYIRNSIFMTMAKNVSR
jgi:hypothetical protein